MTLNNLVCSLEKAKELRDAGFPQDAHFYWARNQGKYELIQRGISNDALNLTRFDDWLAAPTDAEIIARLPPDFIINNEKYYLTMDYLDKNIFDCMYYNLANDKCFARYDTNLADALTKLWIKLKKEGIIK